MAGLGRGGCAQPAGWAGGAGDARRAGRRLAERTGPPRPRSGRIPAALRPQQPAPASGRLEGLAAACVLSLEPEPCFYTREGDSANPIGSRVHARHVSRTLSGSDLLRLRCAPLRTPPRSRRAADRLTTLLAHFEGPASFAQ